MPNRVEQFDFFTNDKFIKEDVPEETVKEKNVDQEQQDGGFSWI